MPGSIEEVKRGWSMNGENEDYAGCQRPTNPKVAAPPSRKGRKYRECHREDYAKGAIRPSCRAFAFQSFVARASAAAHELNSVMSIANVPLEYVRPQRVVKSHVEEAESCICTSGFFTGERPGLNFRV